MKKAQNRHESHKGKKDLLKTKIMQNPTDVKALFAKAETLYRGKENEHDQGNSDGKFGLLKQMVEKGTAKDKLSTLAVMIKDAPEMAAGMLEKILQIVGGGNKKNAFLFIESIQEVLEPVFGAVLVEEVVMFNQSIEHLKELGTKDLSTIPDEKLIRFYFLHKLKVSIEKLIEIMKMRMDEPMSHFKKIAVIAFTGLVRKIPLLQNAVE